MRRRTQYYGWFDRARRTFRVSRLPPDSPVRPSAEFYNKQEIDEFMERKRGDVLWSPPLHADEIEYEAMP